MLARAGYPIDFVVGSWGGWGQSDVAAREGYPKGRGEMGQV